MVETKAVPVQNVDPAYLPIGDRISLFEKASTSPRNATGNTPRSTTPRSSGERQEKSSNTLSTEGTSVVSKPSGPVCVSIATPATGTPADRSRSVTPHTHHRLVKLSGELERSEQDRMEAMAARQAMQKQLDAARRNQLQLETMINELRTQLSEVKAQQTAAERQTPAEISVTLPTGEAQQGPTESTEGKTTSDQDADASPEAPKSSRPPESSRSSVDLLRGFEVYSLDDANWTSEFHDARSHAADSTNSQEPQAWTALTGDEV